MVDPLRELHWGHRRPVLIRPKGMASFKTSVKEAEVIQRVTLSIFTNCANVGVPFQECLAAIYLSGLQHGAKLTNEHQRGTALDSQEPRGTADKAEASISIKEAEDG